MSGLSIHSTLRMNSGYDIPMLGYGVYQTPSDIAESVVTHAVQTGYRHVDSAAVYQNEAPCAIALHKSSLPRSSLFFTSKISPKAMSYDAATECIDRTLELTGLEYIDLYLIHAPYPSRPARLSAWSALVAAQRAGKIRSLGVSNYGLHHLAELEAHIKEVDEKEGPGTGGVVSVGQWEVHPWCERKEIVEWCRERDVVVEVRSRDQCYHFLDGGFGMGVDLRWLQAYCPLVRGERFDEPVLEPLMARYNKTAAQILLRWSLQKNLLPLPKSITPSRITENADVFDFSLTEEEVQSLETGEYAPCSWDPTVYRDEQA
ncbi:MAG: hypothetical protein M1833_002182 [Piccolia ochrophora]|nr:MAG: hypothetical protein M1833_002182 [Piccolia ochrophora]